LKPQAFPEEEKTQINPIHRKTSFIAQMNLFPTWVFSVDEKCGFESTQFFTFYSLHSSQSSTSQPISEPQTVDEKLSSLSDNGDFVFG
jgi:hypothetical protein